MSYKRDINRFFTIFISARKKSKQIYLIKTIGNAPGTIGILYRRFYTLSKLNDSFFTDCRYDFKYVYISPDNSTYEKCKQVNIGFLMETSQSS